MQKNPRGRPQKVTPCPLAEVIHFMAVEPIKGHPDVISRRNLANLWGVGNDTLRGFFRRKGFGPTAIISNHEGQCAVYSLEYLSLIYKKLEVSE